MAKRKRKNQNETKKEENEDNINSSNNNIQALPCELIENIYTFLSGHANIVKAGMTCKDWYVASRSDRIWNQYINYRYPRDEQEKEVRGERIDESQGLIGLKAFICLWTSKVCYICAYRTPKMIEFETSDEDFAMYLCKECKKKKSLTIARTYAKKEYSLTDSDLENLPYLECRNPHYRFDAPMILYLHRMLHEYSLKKRGSQTSLVNKKCKREEISEKRKQTIEWKMQALRTQLIGALNKRGLELREDSRLCDQFIEKGSPNVNEVVRIMEEMKFYHEQTEYTSFYREVFNDWKHEYGFKVDLDEVSDAAKHLALDAWIKKEKDFETMMQKVPLSLAEEVEKLCRKKSK